MSLNENKYKIIKRLGGGSFGEVFLVHHRHLDRDEAAKIIKTKKFAKALQEAKTIQQLQHENIIHIYDADILPDKSGIFITMEYHPQGSITNLKFISRRQLIDLARYVLRALEYAHSKNKGFIHRDIKPNNILLDNQQRAILTDFGLSAKINELATAPPYQYKYHTAPEVIKGKGEENIKTDLYALGATMHRLVNGEPDWLRTLQPDELDEKIAKGKYPERMNYRPDIPTTLVKIINRALNINPLKRYQSAKEMLIEIEKKAVFRYDWEKNDNCWSATINNIDIKIETLRKGNSYNITTSQKNINLDQYRRIGKYCFFEKSKKEINACIQKTISEIDSRFDL
jgi:serine/threonine protein kinase